jgi:hypothetical protein
LASLASINKKFTAIGTTDNNPATSADSTFYLKVLASDKGTKAVYLNVDTVYYPSVGTLIDSTGVNGGLTIGLDTLDNLAPKPGKLAASFQFSVWKMQKIQSSLKLLYPSLSAVMPQKVFQIYQVLHTGTLS